MEQNLDRDATSYSNALQAYYGQLGREEQNSAALKASEDAQDATWKTPVGVAATAALGKPIKSAYKALVKKGLKNAGDIAQQKIEDTGKKLVARGKELLSKNPTPSGSTLEGAASSAPPVEVEGGAARAAASDVRQVIGKGALRQGDPARIFSKFKGIPKDAFGKKADKILSRQKQLDEKYGRAAANKAAPAAEESDPAPKLVQADGKGDPDIAPGEEKAADDLGGDLIDQGGKALSSEAGGVVAGDEGTAAAAAAGAGEGLEGAAAAAEATAAAEGGLNPFADIAALALGIGGEVAATSGGRKAPAISRPINPSIQHGI